MGKREEILAFIARMDKEDETAKQYGDNWKIRDFKTRRSIKAGELCLTVGTLHQAEAKAARHPGSKGAKKAKRKAKEYRRRIKRLEAIIAERYIDYDRTKPEYITTPGTEYKPSPQRRKFHRKNCETTPGGYVS